jgi:hypothetical protein
VTLLEFQTAYSQTNRDLSSLKTADMGDQLEDMLELSKRMLRKDSGYTREDLSAMLSIPAEKLEERLCPPFRS